MALGRGSGFWAWCGQWKPVGRVWGHFYYWAVTLAPGVELISIGAGAVAIGHRPKVRLLPALKTAGVTHLVTLLSEREGALALGSAARAAGLEWIWVDLPNGQEPSPERRQDIAAALTGLAGLIQDGARVVIHCSAGIHRTGMFSYALLRVCGLDPDAAMSTLARLRAVTAQGIGEQRVSWAEDLAAGTGRD